MKKNYRKGIMKVDSCEDEVSKFKMECMEQISRLQYFGKDAETADTISSTNNDGVEKTGNNV